MMKDTETDSIRPSNSLAEIDPVLFRQIGHSLVNDISNLLENISSRPVTRGADPAKLLEIIGDSDLPIEGSSPESVVKEITDKLISNSLYNGHPKFFGFITSSPTHIGILAEMLAAAINQNLGGQILSPLATEIERQTVKWLAQFIGYHEDCGGILVSGGNMANFVAFIAARKAKSSHDIKSEGIGEKGESMIMYVSAETHTWIQKAADLFGLGTNNIRWISCNEYQQMDVTDLAENIKQDLANGKTPFMVVGNAGSVSTGAVDDLSAISQICKTYDLWFHVDGAYGVMAAGMEEYKEMFQGLRDADSVALDPHKWLYSPLEAGCTLVRKGIYLADAFSFKPPYYYKKEEKGNLDYYEYGMQNSRGFRALKVWMAFKHIGKLGQQQLIREDILLTEKLFALIKQTDLLEPLSQGLSIASFRYVPDNLIGQEEALNSLNKALLEDIQVSGELFLSNAIINGKFALRACIVNFRTRDEDIEAIPEIVIRRGQALLGSGAY